MGSSVFDRFLRCFPSSSMLLQHEVTLQLHAAGAARRGAPARLRCGERKRQDSRERLSLSADRRQTHGQALLERLFQRAEQLQKGLRWALQPPPRRSEWNFQTLCMDYTGRHLKD